MSLENNQTYLISGRLLQFHIHGFLEIYPQAQSNDPSDICNPNVALKNYENFGTQEFGT